jgi:autotransporter-associated beta strand protein
MLQQLTKIIIKEKKPMKKTSNNQFTRASVPTILVIACLAGSQAFAADYFHLGGADNVRFDSAALFSNTDGSTTAATVAPGPSDNLFFYNSTLTGPVNLKLLLGGTARTFNSMTFRSNAGTTQINRDVEGGGTGGNTVLSIGAGGITLAAGAGALSFGKLAASGDNQRVTVGAVASFTISNNSANALTFNREFDGRTNNTTQVITVAGSGSGNTIFAGGILANSTGRDLAMVIDRTGAGVVRIEGAGTYTGGTTLNQGTLQVRSSSALGSGGLAINGGILASFISARTLANNVTVGGNFTLGGSGHAITLNGTTNLGGGTRVITTANTATFGGVISNGGISKQGAGSLVLNAQNTYTGATSVTAGTLVIGASASTHADSAVTISNSGSSLVVNGTINGTLHSGVSTILSGSGTVTGAATVAGALNPGNSAGLLSFSNSLTMADTTVTNMEILGLNRGTDYDGIDVGTNLTYKGLLSLALGTTFGTGSHTFNLFGLVNTPAGSFDSVELTGSYAGTLSNSGGVWTTTTNTDNEIWSFDQATGDLSLTVVPEPSVTLLCGIGMLCLLRRRRAKPEPSSSCARSPSRDDGLPTRSASPDPLQRTAI